MSQSQWARERRKWKRRSYIECLKVNGWEKEGSEREEVIPLFDDRQI